MPPAFWAGRHCPPAPGRPGIRVAEAARALGVSTPAAIKALATLEKCGVVHEINGQHCRRHYAYRSDLEILDADAL